MLYWFLFRRPNFKKIKNSKAKIILKKEVCSLVHLPFNFNQYGSIS